jgi:hypothetical protein
MKDCPVYSTQQRVHDMLQCRCSQSSPIRGISARRKPAGRCKQCLPVFKTKSRARKNEKLLKQMINKEP